MPLFQPNDFIRWSSKDEEGNFSHIGEVISCTEDTVVFYGDGYEFTVPLNDGKFAKARRPKDWSVDAPRVEIPPSTPPAKKPRAGKTGSKKERARIIFQNETERSAIIARFQSELDMSPAGAATYYSNFNSGRW